MAEATKNMAHRSFDRQALGQRIREDPRFATDFRKAVSENIGGALRDARHDAGFSQRDVADRMGVSESRIAQIEGEAGASITLRSLLRYAAAVGCRLDVQLVEVGTERLVSKVLVGDDRAQEGDDERTERSVASDPAAGS